MLQKAFEIQFKEQWVKNNYDLYEFDCGMNNLES